MYSHQLKLTNVLITYSVSCFIKLLSTQGGAMKKEYKKPEIMKVQLKPEEILTSCVKLKPGNCSGMPGGNKS